MTAPGERRITILDQLERLLDEEVGAEFPSEQYRARMEFERIVLKNAAALLWAARCLEKMPAPSSPEFFRWQDSRIATLGRLMGVDDDFERRYFGYFRQRPLP